MVLFSGNLCFIMSFMFIYNATKEICCESGDQFVSMTFESDKSFSKEKFLASIDLIIPYFHDIILSFRQFHSIIFQSNKDETKSDLG